MHIVSIGFSSHRSSVVAGRFGEHVAGFAERSAGFSLCSRHLIGRYRGNDYSSVRFSTGARRTDTATGVNSHPGNGYDLTGQGGAGILAGPDAFDLPGRARTRNVHAREA